MTKPPYLDMLILHVTMATRQFFFSAETSTNKTQLNKRRIYKVYDVGQKYKLAQIWLLDGARPQGVFEFAAKRPHTLSRNGEKVGKKYPLEKFVVDF